MMSIKSKKIVKYAVLSFLAGAFIGLVVILSITFVKNKEESAEIETFKSEIVSAVEFFDLEGWYHSDSESYVLEGGHIVIDDGSQAMMVTSDEDEAFIIMIYFEESEHPTTTIIWSIELYYNNYDDNKELGLDYYRTFLGEYLVKELDYTRDDVVEMLGRLSVEDMRDIFIELGYDDYA